VITFRGAKIMMLGTIGQLEIMSFKSSFEKIVGSGVTGKGRVF